MHAVLINDQTIDLIATNNGGLKPDVEAWGSYFVLPTDPNDHAEIVSAELFENNYYFVGPEDLDKFRPIKPILRFSRNEPYQIDRDQLAQMIAAHTSGLSDAIPEQADYENADEMLEVLERLISE